MKRLISTLVLLGLLLGTGCVVREGHGGGDDHYWHGYGHEEHWDHDHDH